MSRTITAISTLKRICHDATERRYKLLLQRSKEYARHEDTLHNFYRAAALRGTTPEDALWGMATKHIVSVTDIVTDTKIGKYADRETLCTKLDDLRNYCDLLEALFLARELGTHVAGEE